MQQVKLFKGVESAIVDLERDINEWIRETGAKVVHVRGNIAPQSLQTIDRGSSQRTYPPSDVLVIVTYETS